MEIEKSLTNEQLEYITGLSLNICKVLQDLDPETLRQKPPVKIIEEIKQLYLTSNGKGQQDKIY